MQLFLDMDGVLADFNKRAREILGMEPEDFEARFGKQAFWLILQSSPDFYNSFDLMLDAPFLLDATRHLGPIVLTGVPMGEWAQPQKRQWIMRNTGLNCITCRAKDKSLHAQPGDVLVDDRGEYADVWEAKCGPGTFVLHKSAHRSLKDLRAIGVLD